MNREDQKKLFDELCHLYQKTKKSSEPFTFWPTRRKTDKDKEALFNQGENYLNIGIVKFGSASNLQLAGFHFVPDTYESVKLLVVKRKDDKDIQKLIKEAKDKGQTLTIKQVQSFLESISSLEWEQETSVIDDNLINKLQQEYEEFFKYIKDYDAKNNTCFYDILKIDTTTCDNKIKKAEEKINDWISKGMIKQPENGNDDSEFSHPLNLILYGPPGTGKTYNTVNKALDIVEPNWRKDFEDQKSSSGGEKDERKYAQQRFDYYKDTTGQIVFTTFHQSMSYEDFIEGIKPIADDTDVVAIHNNNNSKSMVTQFGNGTTKIENLSRMKYEVKDGIFKQICVKARKSSEITHTIILNDVFDYFCFDIEKYGSNIELYRGNVKYRIKEVAALKNGNYDVIRFDRNKAGVRLEVLRDNYDDYKNGKIKSPSDIKYGHNELAFGLLQEIEEFENNKYPKYKGKIDTTKKQKKENYVLIIDEINRGNVAQIFGELITLIEPSKRLDNAEPLTATLPYSPDDEPFGVPNNLYIIGTMNTADRSVEALDTALRRRFSFEEMMPDPELLKDDKDQYIEVCGVKLSELLKTINDRIVALKDREHQIGHSYFMGHDDKNEDGSDKYQNKEEWLTNVFKDKIIPLLQEYFYGDYKKIYYVLGPGFVEKKTGKTIFAVDVTNDGFDFDIPEEKYEIKTESFDIQQAIKDLKVQF